MARPAPKGALRKAPSNAHPIAPAAREAGDDSPVVPAATAPSTPAVAPMTTAAATPPLASTPPSSAEPAAPLAMFSVRLDPALRRRVKRYAAEQDTSLQDVTTAALTEYLERRRS